MLSGVFACLLCVVFLTASAAPDVPATAKAQKEQALLHKLESVTAEHGEVSELAIQPLLDLGGLYVEEDRCSDAIAVLTRAVQISRAAYGLFNVQQLELTEPLMECYLALDLTGDFAREQRYALLISDKNFGADDPRALATLQRIGRWYVQAGWYISARELYTRAAEIAHKAGSGADLKRADLLRAIANSFRLEYMHGIDPVDAEAKRGSRLRSAAQLRGVYTQLDRLGEDSLKSAIEILRAHAEAESAELIDALLELGDWYQMGFAQRDALRMYGQAWMESQKPGYSGEPLFAKPVPVLYQAHEAGIALRRPPPQRENYQHYWVRFDFTVTAGGEVKDLKVVESNAPEVYQWRLTDSFKETRFRPRFVQGKPVSTEHMRWRQGMYVEGKKKPQRHPD